MQSPEWRSIKNSLARSYDYRVSVRSDNRLARSLDTFQDHGTETENVRSAVIPRNPRQSVARIARYRKFRHARESPPCRVNRRSRTSLLNRSVLRRESPRSNRSSTDASSTRSDEITRYQCRCISGAGRRGSRGGICDDSAVIYKAVGSSLTLAERSARCFRAQ